MRVIFFVAVGAMIDGAAWSPGAAVQITSKAREVGKGWCDASPRFSVPVRGNAFAYILRHPNLPADFTRTFQVTIGPDGSFDAQTTNGDASMSGRITETRMTGQITGEGCDYAFTAQHS
jgi:hypothetical protein